MKPGSVTSRLPRACPTTGRNRLLAGQHRLRRDEHEQGAEERHGEVRRAEARKALVDPPREQGGADEQETDEYRYRDRGAGDEGVGKGGCAHYRAHPDTGLAFAPEAQPACARSRTSPSRCARPAASVRFATPSFL